MTHIPGQGPHRFPVGLPTPPLPPPPTTGGGTGVGTGQQLNPGAFNPPSFPGTDFLGQTGGPRPGGNVRFFGGGAAGGGGAGGFGGTGISFEDVLAALEAQEGKVRGAFGAPLGAGTGQFGQLGATLLEMLRNPQGFGAENLRASRTRIAEREAGIRTGGFQRLSNASSRAGFGGGRPGDVALRESLRGQSGARITDAELALDREDALLRQQNLMAALQAALGTANISAGLQGQLGGILGSAFNPLALQGLDGGPGAGGGGGLPTSFGDVANRLPGESLADQIRREAAARQAQQSSVGG